MERKTKKKHYTTEKSSVLFNPIEENSIEIPFKEKQENEKEKEEFISKVKSFLAAPFQGLTEVGYLNGRLILNGTHYTFPLRISMNEAAEALKSIKPRYEAGGGKVTPGDFLRYIYRMRGNPGVKFYYIDGKVTWFKVIEIYEDHVEMYDSLEIPLPK